MPASIPAPVTLHRAQVGQEGRKSTLMANISVDQQQLAEFCRQRHIRRMAFFGSVLRADFGPESDIDVLVEFEPSHVPGLFGIARMERELSTLFGGRKVDLRTPEDLSRYFRDDVLKEAEVQYAQG
jgi:predicted nucleotidyltransferase